MNSQLDTKRCKDCGEDKSLEEFYLTSVAKKSKKPRIPGGSRMPYCKDCWSLRNKVKYKKNKKHHDKTVKERAVYLKAQDPVAYAAAQRRSWLKYTYGITPEEWDNLYDLQLGRCAICLVPLAEAKPHLDHCHKTGQIRGLLCSHCNAGLGQFKDNPERLRQAAIYLEESRRNRSHSEAEKTVPVRR